MTLLVWEPVDVLKVVGTVPDISDYGIAYRYVVQQYAIQLELEIRPMSAEVQFTLWAQPLLEPVLKYAIIDCPGIRVVNDKRGTFLEFAAGNTFTGRYDGYSVIPYGVRLRIEPQIALETFVYNT